MTTPTPAPAAPKSLPMRIFIANVGVNNQLEQKYGLRSPVFRDGGFELLPIPEESAAPTPTYAELRSWTRTGETLADVLSEKFLPRREHPTRTHNDPDFVSCVYGDVLRYEGPHGRLLSRSAGLRELHPGDELWFLVRLWESQRASSQYLVGYFLVEIPPVVVPSWGPLDLSNLSPGTAERIRRGANYRRLLAGEAEEAIFIVGDTTRSCRFEKALRVDAEVARVIYGADEYRSDADRYYRNGGLLLNKTTPTPRTFTRFAQVTRTIQPLLSSDEHPDAVRELQFLASGRGCPGSTSQ